jgi:hypothetical protein
MKREARNESLAVKKFPLRNGAAIHEAAMFHKGLIGTMV